MLISLLVLWRVSPLDDLQLITLGVAEADDAAAAGRDARLGKKRDALLPKRRVRVFEIVDSQREVPEPGGKSCHSGRLLSLVPRRHEFDHGAVFQVLVIPEQRGGRV